MRPAARTGLAAIAVAVGVLGGCASPAPVIGSAAEPAEAPAPSRPPAGALVPVGALAEGVVADAATGTVAVAVQDPYRLVLLDRTTGAVRAEVPLPGHVRHLQLAAAGGPVLVPVEESDELVRVGLPDGRVVGRAPTGDFPHDATATATGLVFVANEFGGTVSVLDGDRTVTVFDEPAQPGGIAAAGDVVGLIDVAAATLTFYDAIAPVRLARLPAGNGPTHVIADRRGRLAVTDTRGDALLIYDPAGPRLLSTTPLPGRPYALAYDPNRDRLWVTLTDRNELVGLDMGSGTPIEAVRAPTVRQPNSVGVDSSTGRVFVASRTDGTVQLFDPPTA
jgi:DNA-binding beta-propeller fold protein YncE